MTAPEERPSGWGGPAPLRSRSYWVARPEQVPLRPCLQPAAWDARPSSSPPPEARNARHSWCPRPAAQAVQPRRFPTRRRGTRSVVVSAEGARRTARRSGPPMARNTQQLWYRGWRRTRSSRRVSSREARERTAGVVSVGGGNGRARPTVFVAGGPGAASLSKAGAGDGAGDRAGAGGRQASRPGGGNAAAFRSVESQAPGPVTGALLCPFQVKPKARQAVQPWPSE